MLDREAAGCRPPPASSIAMTVPVLANCTSVNGPKPELPVLVLTSGRKKYASAALRIAQTLDLGMPVPLKMASNLSHTTISR